MSRASRIKDTVSMWDVLELLDIDYSVGSAGDAFIFAWDRDERTPSVHVNDTLWHDFGSGTGGDVISFIESYCECSFRRAIEILERQEGSLVNDTRHRAPTKAKVREPMDLGIRLEMETRDPSDWLRSKFTEKHGLPDNVMDVWDIREGPGGAAWIPHLQEGGSILPMIKVRDYVTEKKVSVSGSMAVGLYMLNGIKPTDNWVLCEGESDTWTMEFQFNEAGIQGWSAVGLPSGVSKWEHEWFTDMDLSKGLVCFDNDTAGRKAAQQVTAALGILPLHLPEEYNDVNEAHQAGWRVVLP